MKTIKNEHVIFVDIDDTLVMWEPKLQEEHAPVSIYDPHLQTTLWAVPNKGNIRLVKEKKSRGATIIVWSQGGWEYAEAVVNALCLQEYVDFVMSKPSGYIDDLAVTAWFPNRIYIPVDVRYKD